MISYNQKEIQKLRVVNLASGSKGNSYFVSAGNTKILIDCGISYKQLTERLSEIGESPSNIDYILISHEHSDHTAGLETFCKKHNTRVYVNHLSAEYIAKNKPSIAEFLQSFDREVMSLGEFLVYPIPVSHDSVFCTAFKIECEDGSVSIVTDLGFVDENILGAVAGSKVVYIESNHDENMLMNCKYPYIIKKRILSDHGHLSNRAAANAISRLYNFGTKYFVLSHISENSNTYEKAYVTIANILLNDGIDPDKDLTIRFAHQHKVGNNFILGGKHND